MPRTQTETTVPTADPHALLAAFVDHLREDHGVEMAEEEDGSRVLDHDAFRIALAERAGGLHVSLSGPSETALLFVKEEIVQQVEAVEPAAAQGIRWAGQRGAVGERPANVDILTVRDSREIFTGMQRVTLHAPGLVDRSDDGIHVRLMMPLAPGRPPVWPVMGANGVAVWPQGDDKLHTRFVTIKSADPGTGLIEIDIARHDHGLISLWAQAAKPGQEVGAMGPAGASDLPEVPRYLLAADATGLPAIARLLAAMGPDRPGDVVVAAPADCDLATYLPPTSMRLHKLDPTIFEAEVGPRIRALTTRGKTGYALFLGEFANAQDLRKHFKGDLGLDKTGQIAAAYWRRGIPGFGS